MTNDWVMLSILFSIAAIGYYLGRISESLESIARTLREQSSSLDQIKELRYEIGSGLDKYLGRQSRG